MDKILDVEKAIRVAEKLRKQKKEIVLVGGCFDILHVGHITFLKNAKKRGDVLFVLLENDRSVQQKKGKDRPIYNQKDRAKVLETIGMVDYIIPLPLFSTDKQYDKLIFQLKPTIIATTKGDPNRKHKERQATLMGVGVVDVIKRLPNKSTSGLAKTLAKKNEL